LSDLALGGVSRLSGLGRRSDVLHANADRVVTTRGMADTRDGGVARGGIVGEVGEMAAVGIRPDRGAPAGLSLVATDLEALVARILELHTEEARSPARHVDDDPDAAVAVSLGRSRMGRCAPTQTEDCQTETHRGEESHLNLLGVPETDEDP